METVDISKIASAGKVTAMDVNIGTNLSANNSNNNGGAEPTEEQKQVQADEAEKYKGLSPEQITAKKTEEATAAAEAEKNKLPELSEDQLKALFKQQFGEDFDGNIENLKGKLKAPAQAAAEPTAEEKAKIEAEWDKKQLDVYIAAGGTIENYAAIKNVIAMDLTELSKTELKKELKAANFNDEEIEAIMKERYYQLNPDELVWDEDNETEKEFEARKAALKKKVEYGTTKLVNRSLNTKKQAEAVLKNLRTAIEQSDKQKLELEKEEKEFLSTVDETLKAYPKKVTFELGKVNDTDQPPVEYEVSESEVSEVLNILKDKTARNNILFKEDGSLNGARITEILLENKYLKNANKVLYSEGVSRTTEFFYSKFGGKPPHELGIGASGKKTDGVKGKIVSAAAPQPSQRPVHAT